MTRPAELVGNWMKAIWSTWWTGVLVLVPATLTLYILWRLFETLDAVGSDLFGPTKGDVIPGLSLVFLFTLIFGTGLLTTQFLGQRLILWAESAVETIPLVRSIYTTLKGMTDLFQFRARFGRSTVVVFPFPRERMWALGLVMGIAPTSIERAIGSSMLMVFVPTAIHPFTGYLAFVPPGVVTPLSLPVEEAMKVEFSAGLYRPSERWLETAGRPPERSA